MKQSTEVTNIGFGLAMLAIAQLRPRSIDPTGVYTMQEAAGLCSCEYQSIFRAIQHKQLKAGGIGRSPRVVGRDLLAWVEAGGRTGQKEVEE